MAEDTRLWRPSNAPLAAVPPSALPETFPPGRRCPLPECITILCRYNPGPHCYAHRHLEDVELEDASAA